MKKTIILAAFTAAMVLMSVSCNGKKENAVGKVETKIITDHLGEQVEIPVDPQRIVIGSILPLPSVYCMYAGSADKIVGMVPSSMAAAQNSYLATLYPNVINCDTSFAVNGEINTEELLKLNPDVVFYSAANQADKDAFKASGIPSVGFAVNLAGYNSMGTYVSWIELLDQIFGKSEKSQKMIEYGYEVEKEITKRVEEIDSKDKPKVLILFQYNNGTIVAGGSQFFSQYWIETSGGVNVAADLTAQAQVNMEQIYEWDPDIIYITNFSPVLAEDILENKIEGHDWSPVKAVKEGKVYKIPMGTYRWFPPSSDTPLALQWFAKHNQPEVFKDIDMDQEIKTYYKKFYNVTLTDDDLQNMYNPNRAASGKK